MVETPDGDVPISEIEVGDTVIAYNEDTGTIEEQVVTHTYVHDDEVIVTLSINGEDIETTPTHPFYTDEGWVEAEDLELGDAILSLSGIYGTVEAILIEERTETMYDLTVESVHTFAVGDGDWVVHNTNSKVDVCNLPLRNGNTVTITSLHDLQDLWLDNEIAGGILFRGRQRFRNQYLIAPRGNRYANGHNINLLGLRFALDYSWMRGEGLEEIISEHVKKNEYLVSSTNNLYEAVGYATRNNAPNPYMAIMQPSITSLNNLVPTHLQGNAIGLSNYLAGRTTLVMAGDINIDMSASLSLRNMEYGTFVEVKQSEILGWLPVPRDFKRR